MKIPKKILISTMLILALLTTGCGEQGEETKNTFPAETEQSQIVVNTDEKNLTDVTSESEEENDSEDEKDLLSDDKLTPIENDKNSELFVYSESDEHTITIFDYKGDSTDVIIPDNLGGRAVVSLFCLGRGFDRIEKLVIPDSVQLIDESLFHRCEQLRDITFPKYFELTSTDPMSSQYTFLDNTPWIKIQREKNPLVIIGDTVIDGRTCSGKIEIPEGVTRILDWAFLGNKNITDIYIPDSVTYIGERAFSKCESLENIKFPNNIVEMGAYIFGYPDNYSEEIPWLRKKLDENLMVIENGNLINANLCTGDIVIPNEVKSIAKYAFSNSQITSVIMPDDITEIDDYVFAFCNNLTSVKLPKNLKKLGGGVFRGDYTYNGEDSNPQITEIIIPDGVTEILPMTFFNCRCLEKVTLPANLESIGSSAFVGTAITELTLPESLKFIGESAFRNSKISSVVIPDGVRAIHKGAFYKCADLKEITLPKKLKSIGEYAFDGSALHDILILPDGLEEIDKYAFNDTLITQLILPDSIKHVSPCAFKGIKGMFANGLSAIVVYKNEGCMAEDFPAYLINGGNDIKADYNYQPPWE